MVSGEKDSECLCQEGCHSSSRIKMRHRAKLIAAMTQTPSSSLTGAAGHALKSSIMTMNANTMPTTISTSRCVMSDAPR
jgi:hypothetical protein